ncbi:ADP-ribosylation factor [Tetrabaena socialis]|uniref:ADP-ribosylation factor n=1 Tax=Tetrabaena socialis TaxID=47790 RepID=A0A2J8AKC5_9CHLO|nr:ADP-ribosylation factor [Tetrabaena socialis]|eukprot:PNH12963.1 ADP-ribosylation factor [Tetrabaena socialis]
MPLPGWLGGSREVNPIILLGLRDAGKTTLLSGLQLGNPVTMVPAPAIGIAIDTRKCSGLRIHSWGVGGSDRARPVWRQFHTGAAALVFVVDCNDRARVREAREELWLYLAEPSFAGVHLLLLGPTLQESSFAGVPLLLLANKQDLPRAMSPAELARELGLAPAHPAQPQLSEPTPAAMLAREALHMFGVHQGFDWLAGAISRARALAPPAPAHSAPFGATAPRALGDPSPALTTLPGWRQRRAAAAHAAPERHHPHPSAAAVLSGWLSEAADPADTDNAFLAQLEGCTLARWDDCAHLRVAWLYLQDAAAATAVALPDVAPLPSLVTDVERVKREQEQRLMWSLRRVSVGKAGGGPGRHAGAAAAPAATAERSLPPTPPPLPPPATDEQLLAAVLWPEHHASNSGGRGDDGPGGRSSQGGWGGPPASREGSGRGRGLSGWGGDALERIAFAAIKRHGYMGAQRLLRGAAMRPTPFSGCARDDGGDDCDDCDDCDHCDAAPGGEGRLLGMRAGALEACVRSVAQLLALFLAHACESALRAGSAASLDSGAAGPKEEAEAEEDWEAVEALSDTTSCGASEAGEGESQGCEGCGGGEKAEVGGDSGKEVDSGLEAELGTAGAVTALQSMPQYAVFRATALQLQLQQQQQAVASVRC